MKKVILFVIVGIIFSSCQKKAEYDFPKGFMDFFPYEIGENFLFLNGNDTVSMKIDKFHTSSDGCQHYEEKKFEIKCIFSKPLQRCTLKYLPLFNSNWHNDEQTLFVFDNFAFYFFVYNSYCGYSVEDVHLYGDVDVDSFKEIAKLSTWEIETPHAIYVLKKDKGITQIRLADGVTWTLIE